MSTITDLDGDLFDYLPEIAHERHTTRNQPIIAALTCLRDAVPNAVRAVAELHDWHTRDDNSCGLNGEWAYSITHAGIRWDGMDTWQGFARRPTNLLTWAQLTHHVGNDPRRQHVTAWVNTLTAPDRWRDLTRPFELHPDPEQWHPSYIEADHARPGWDARIEAWITTRGILTDAIARLANAQERPA